MPNLPDHRPPTPDPPGGPLASWFSTPHGARLIDVERGPLAEAVRRCHGDALLWLGSVPALVDVTARCMVRLTVHNTGSAGASGNVANRTASGIVADPADLPLATACLDGVVLHHVLESVGDPRAVVREATRTLRPGGRLVVACFNPFSLWSVAWLRPSLRTVRPVSTFRLGEWLAVLGFERNAPPVHMHFRGALPLCLQSERWQRASKWVNEVRPPLGGVYLVSATKVGHATILEQRRRRIAERSLGPALPNPARRQAA